MIYILGTERSASTWLANLLDHHSGLDVIMEPLSSFNSRFSDWPNRFTKLEDLDTKAEDFKDELDILKSHNRFLFTRISSASKAWNTDLKLAEWLVKKKIAASSIIDFLELNFHRKNRQIDVKKTKPLQTVIKEVRLNFNADLLKNISPDIQILVPIREMASTVQSINLLIENGHLIDLKRDILHEFGNRDIQTLCKFWFMSYSSLLETLDMIQVPYQIVSHTDLLRNPTEVTEKIFDFLDLSIEHSIKEYLELSNKTGTGKHSTTRSKTNLLKSISEDRKKIHPIVEKELSLIHDHPVLKKFAGGI